MQTLEAAQPNDQAIKQQLQQLTRQLPLKIDLGLERVRNFLQQLQQPHHYLPPTITIAGTNGKGSTLAYLLAFARAAGISAHAFVSPHLVRFNERIILNHQQISNHTLAGLIDAGKAVLSKPGMANKQLTFFEFITAIAFKAFADHPAQLLLIETGLGGLLDATNVIPAPCCNVITAIDYDHQAYLGNTLTAIAGEKAGIFRRNTPIICAPQRPSVLRVLRQQAKNHASPIFAPPAAWQVSHDNKEMQLTIAKPWRQHASFPLPRLAGNFQISNAATAIVTAKIVAACTTNIDFPQPAIVTGLQRVQHPARLQPLSDPELPLSWQLFLDGGHNPAAAEQIATWIQQRSRPVYLAVAMLRTKDWRKALRRLGRNITASWCLPAGRDPHYNNQKFVEQEEMANYLRNLAIPTTIKSSFADWQADYRQLAQRQQQGCILIFGSLYLAGEILSFFNTIDKNNLQHDQSNQGPELR